MMEGEEGESILSAISGDRVNIGLPDNQVGFIKELALQGAKIILVLSGGSPIALNEVEDFIEAVVMVWYPGEEGGNALAEILFGDYSPSGKLPMTFPRSLEQLPPFDNYSMSERTYRYSSAVPLYPFGFGLGYAQFRYSNLHIDKPVIKSGDSLQATVTITNISNYSAEEVVQVYLSALNSSIPVPLHSLIDFQRVALLPMEQKCLSFIITPQMMSVINIAGNEILLEGEYRLEIGSCSPGERGQQLGAPTPKWVTFTIA
jgi:beta-glucosidase